LDAPNLQDDFYLNLVDWSQSNQLAVALGTSVYIWNANTVDVSELTNIGDLNQVTSVAWSDINRGNYLSVGTLDGKIQIWDV
jgi:cell division cycle 20-like protein 1 (cofactor of APC complex)